MATSPALDIKSEIAKLEEELNAVVALSSLSDSQREKLRERLRQLKVKAEAAA